jgi:MFS family permease
MSERVRFTQALDSLQNRNYRLFLLGSTASNLGEWAQRIGQAWLVLQLSDSAVLLGVTAALQAAPMVLIGPWAGLWADRMNKLTLLKWTQSASGLLAAALGVLTFLGAIDVVGVLMFATALGSVKALDQPARQGLILELVGTRRLVNAVTLHNISFNVAKSIGPALAGLIISTLGIGPSFIFNAATYIALIVALSRMDRSTIEFPPTVERAPKQLRDGLRYVLDTPVLAWTMALMTVVGMLGFEQQVLLPIFATEVFNGNATTLGAMFTSMGVGAIIGGLLVAGRLRTHARALLLASTIFALTFAAHGAANNLVVAYSLLFFLGAATTVLRALGQSILLSNARSDMRGRVASLLSVAFLGTTLVGGPLIGWLTEVLGVRWVFVLIGVCILLAALGAFVRLRLILTDEPEPAP